VVARDSRSAAAARSICSLVDPAHHVVQEDGSPGATLREASTAPFLCEELSSHHHGQINRVLLERKITPGGSCITRWYQVEGAARRRRAGLSFSYSPEAEDGTTLGEAELLQDSARCRSGLCKVREWRPRAERIRRMPGISPAEPQRGCASARYESGTANIRARRRGGRGEAERDVGEGRAPRGAKKPERKRRDERSETDHSRGESGSQGGREDQSHQIIAARCA